MEQGHPRWIGSDEAGKGDYFGPLVVAAVLMDRQSADELSGLGVKDSKRLSESSIARLSATIRTRCVHSVVAVGPLRYNELYERMHNLNRLLAWGHSRAIENILREHDCDYAVADQFGDERFIVNALMERGKRLDVRQRVRAEDDAGVAAASILARAEFVQRLRALSDRYGMSLPKGASAEVTRVAKEFVKRYGPKTLREVAKVHFRTTAAVVSDLT
jgi:ribonuclease HIII